MISAWPGRRLASSYGEISRSSHEADRGKNESFRDRSRRPGRTTNRLALAPVKTAFGETDGLATDRHVAYYRRRAQGGVGLIILEPLFVDPMGREHPRQLGAHTDEGIPGLRQIVEAVHAEGSRIFAHLNHAGRAANPKVIGGSPEAPSAVQCPTSGATPEPMSTARIRKVLGAYGEAARRAREAGFDGVELQLGLGYLPAQFLSPRTNLRTDEWGGVDGRWRFTEEVAAAVHGALGPGLALSARISADEKVDGVLEIDDAIELGRRLEGSEVDALHVVTGSACDSPPWYYQHMALPSGVNEVLASQLRAAVAMPVMVADVSATLTGFGWSSTTAWPTSWHWAAPPRRPGPPAQDARRPGG